MPRTSQRRQREEHEVGEALAKWLRAAMLRPDGTEKLSKEQIVKIAKVGRTSLWNLYTGKGARVEPDTLARIADLLNVPTPRIHLTVDLEGGPSRMTTPIAKLREAQTLLREATAQLEDGIPATPAVAAAKAAHRVVEKQAGHSSRRRSG